MKDEIINCVRDFLAIPPYLTACEYGVNNIDFKFCISANQERLNLELSPYLVDAINAFDYTGERKEITVIGIEQAGKSLVFIAGLLWCFEYKPSVSLVLYPSLDKAVKMNDLKILPLLKAIPDYKDILKRRDATSIDSFKFPTFTSYFLGAGSEITSISASQIIVDELDDVLDTQGGESKLNAMRKRARSFDESLLVKVSTPRGGSNSKIWNEFLNSSQGWWHLRCQKCQELSIRSADIYHLQFERHDDGSLVANSCRLICPSCGRKHTENEKYLMNRQGAYIHKFPERISSNPGFHFGGLAVNFGAVDWNHIALSQIKAGSTGDYKDQLYLDNSIRALPFKARKHTDANLQVLKSHCISKDLYPEILFRFMGVDTQDNGLFYVIRGIDNQFNSYLLQQGFVHDFKQLSEVYTNEISGGYISMLIIDEGGHRLQEIKHFISAHKGTYQYKGNARIGVNWKVSEESRRRLLANPVHFKSELLYKIYNKTQNGFGDWFIYENIEQQYLDQILDIRAGKKGADSYENWESTGNDHLFDCEKMLLVLLEYFKYLQVQKR